MKLDIKRVTKREGTQWNKRSERREESKRKLGACVNPFFRNEFYVCLNRFSAQSENGGISLGNQQLVYSIF